MQSLMRIFGVAALGYAFGEALDSSRGLQVDATRRLIGQSNKRQRDGQDGGVLKRRKVLPGWWNAGNDVVREDASRDMDMDDTNQMNSSQSNKRQRDGQDGGVLKRRKVLPGWGNAGNDVVREDASRDMDMDDTNQMNSSRDDKVLGHLRSEAATLFAMFCEAMKRLEELGKKRDSMTPRRSSNLDIPNTIGGMFAYAFKWLDYTDEVEDLPGAHELNAKFEEVVRKSCTFMKEVTGHKMTILHLWGLKGEEIATEVREGSAHCEARVVKEFLWPFLKWVQLHQ